MAQQEEVQEQDTNTLTSDWFPEVTTLLAVLYKEAQPGRDD
jgi:hypothetical protein